MKPQLNFNNYSKRFNALKLLRGPSQRLVCKQFCSSSKTVSPKGGIVDTLLWFPRTYPFTFQVIFATGKTAISDLIVQVTIEKRDKIDWKRNAVFAMFGFGYLGLLQW